MAFALITGASGGIGWALARELASRRHDVLLVARTSDTLAKNCAALVEEYHIHADYFAVDLSVPDATLRLKAWLDEKNYPVDILVNNAGFGFWGNLEEIPRHEVNQMMQLNMVTLADLTKILLPELKKHQKAFILNVASTAAYQAVPTLTTYAATKAFVLLFSRGLRRELRGTSVSVSCLSPGATSTGFIDRAKMDKIRDRAEKVSMTPESVAKAGIQGMLSGKAEIIPGIANVVSAKLAEILPKSLIETIAHNLYKVK